MTNHSFNQFEIFWEWCLIRDKYNTTLKSTVLFWHQNTKKLECAAGKNFTITQILMYSGVHSWDIQCSCTVNHSLTHWITHSLTQWITQSVNHSLSESLTHSLSESFAHSLTHSVNHSLTHSLSESLSHSLNSKTTESIWIFPSWACGLPIFKWSFWFWTTLN